MDKLILSEKFGQRIVLGCAIVLFCPAVFGGQDAGRGLSGPLDATQAATARRNLPPRVEQAERFLRERGLTPQAARRMSALRARRSAANVTPLVSGTTAWTAFGPTAVSSLSYGLVSGRITALALDPSDSTGNHLYLGATGGGVWRSVNAQAATASVVFTPLTDDLAALSGIMDASISIGALTVQPGGTGVLLAGTGDPNDALDSYYGSGILRSTNSGNSWSLITASSDEQDGMSTYYFSFAGEGFAGFAWSTVNPQLVVAAVSQAYEGVVVDALSPNASYEGLYYSTDSGATWHLATITDGAGVDVQGPLDSFTLPDGNAATAVVWNPVRKLFIAAVRYHGYYQSSDGVTWTRMAVQPGSGLSTAACPTNPGQLGSSGCPIFRGSLAVNPLTGDTFAWTVDVNNQDQGLWQDQCQISGSSCTQQTITFSQHWSTAALETDSFEGPQTIANGDYNLSLSAVPSEQDTILLAGANDLWRCSIYEGCPWRNTTNFDTCMSAAVGGYQHALAWNPANPLEIFLGNDSGLWRSQDAIGETGSVCASTDASHFQNLNGTLGSLAEVVSLAQSSTTPYTLMAGLGVNGTAGVKGTSAPPAEWPEILSGEGGPVAIDPNNTLNWYVNNQAGVSIYRCSQSAACTQTAFGSEPVVTDADTGDDGYTMTTPAPFLVDPLSDTQLLIGTCRVWRGPANGSGWSSSNAISPILDNSSASSCDGDPLIRSMAAQAVGTSEVVYLGMYGALDGGAILPGHLFRAVVTPGSTPTWQDLTSNPVTNDTETFNQDGFDISSIFIDPHDTTGNTVYVTIEGQFIGQAARVLYRSTDGGAHWASITSNLPVAPANSVAVDPGDANTVYVATDTGVYSTRSIASCATASSTCWAAYGTGLPEAPVVQLSASPAGSSQQFLLAGTYGRGIWENPLWTAGETLTTATVSPTSLTFANQVVGTSSTAQTLTLTDKGSAALTPSTITMSGDFTETDNCVGESVKDGSSCTIHITFTPSATGTRSGQAVISANLSGGQITVPLTGTGITAGSFSVAPTLLSFGAQKIATTSATLQVTASNSGGTAVSISSVKTSGPFAISSNVCGSSLAANSQCQVLVDFTPTASGAATGTLTFTDAVGTQSVSLSGTGEAAATDTLSATSLNFPATAINQDSAPAAITLTNNGDLPLESIGTSVSGNFQASTNCGSQLAGHSSCTIDVIFNPLSTGSLTGSLIVSDSIRAQTVTLTGRGALPPAFSFSNTTITFGSEEIGTSSSPGTLTVSNTGGLPMANLSFQLTGANPNSFSISSSTTTCGATLNNGSNCYVRLIFTPAAVGINTALLVATTSSPGVTAGVITLTGTGLAPPQFTPNPTSLLFGNVIEDTTSGAEPVKIKNTGGSAVTDMQVSATGDFAAAMGSCTPALAAAASCNATVTFTPTALGLRYGTMTISSASGEAPPVTVSLSGTGVAPATITPNQTSLSFGSISQGQVSSAQTLSITDVGTESLAGLTYTITAPFQLTQNQCTTTLSAGKSCSMQVDFAPTAVGSQSGTLTITSTTAGVPSLVVTLTGTGLAAPNLQVSAQLLTFGGVQIGSSSTPISISISNSGAASLTGLALSLTGDFSLSANTCVATLAAGASCSTNVIFTPTATGTRTGTLNITSTSSGVPPSVVALTGTGLGPGALTGTPSNINFGSLTVGFTSGIQSATILNTGTVAAGGLQFHITGDFSLPSNTCGASLPAGNSCTVNITFSPSAAGTRAGILTLSSTTSGVGSATIALLGTGLPTAYLAASPDPVTFPNTAQGIASSPISVALSNPGIAAVSGIQLATSGDFSATLCATALNPETSCKISVVFTPTAQGVRTGQLTFTSTQTGVPTLSVPLAGTGTAPPSLSLSPVSLTFPGTAIGLSTTASTITVSNPGTAPLNVPTTQISGDFEVSGNGCAGQPLAAGSSCNLQIEFTPTEAGGRSGTLTVSSTTKGVASVSATLSGTGLNPADFTVSPMQLNFPVVLTGQTSQAQTITITNTGGVAASAVNLSVNAVQFALTANTCSGSLGAGVSCSVGVTFSPTTNGTATGSLIIASPSVAVPVVVSLSGTGGVPAALNPLPTLLTFATTGVKQTSSPLTVTLSNPGTVTAVTGLSLTVAGPFQLANNTCGASLAAQGSCTTNVVFAPTSAGSQTGSLTITGTAGTGSAAVALSSLVTLAGTGFDFTLTPAGATSQTVINGQTASYTLDIMTLNGSEGSFTFQSADLPPNTLCTFNPATEAVTSAATGNVKVQIATGQSLVSSTARETAYERMLPLACALLLVPWAWKRRRRVLLLVALLAVLTGGVTSCLGSSSGGSNGEGTHSGQGITPVGTYAIPITAVSNGVQHQVMLTLTVD